MNAKKKTYLLFPITYTAKSCFTFHIGFAKVGILGSQWLLEPESTPGPLSRLNPQELESPRLLQTKWTPGSLSQLRSRALGSYWMQRAESTPGSFSQLKSQALKSR